MAKIVPAQRTFVVSIADNTHTIVDIAHCLSVINRRLYRQGMMYYIESIKCATPLMVGMTSVAPDTWVTHNAWKKGFETWRTMQNEYGDGLGASMKGKWADFKVLLDDSGHSFTTPVDGNPAGFDAYLLGDWVYSNFVYDDAGTARSPAISLIGNTVDDTHIGLIESYGDSRVRVRESPSVDDPMRTGFYAQFHGVGDIDDELGVDLQDDNDVPPYDLNDYPGGNANGDHPCLQDVFATTAEFPIAQMNGFAAPCGLVKIFQDNQSNAAATFLITVAAGPYKGVMAEPMGQ